jgi:hypothetical protein
VSDRAQDAPGVETTSEFDHEAAQRILRRAVHLAEDGNDHDAWDGVSERALVEAAEELGLDVAAVRRAASEERLGLLSPPSTRLDALVGPGSLRIGRIAPGEPAAVLERVDAWLRRVAPLRRQRGDAMSASYGRRSDVVASVQRSVRSVTGAEDLRRVRRVHVVARPIDRDSSMVVLVADLELERSLAVATGAGVAGVGSAVAVVEALVWTPWIWLGVPASLAAGGGVLVARRHGVPDVRSSLEGVLDRVESGESPPSVLGGVTDRVLRGVGRSRRPG